MESQSINSTFGKGFIGFDAAYPQDKPCEAGKVASTITVSGGSAIVFNNSLSCTPNASFGSTDFDTLSLNVASFESQYGNVDILNSNTSYSATANSVACNTLEQGKSE